jgi:hypothetical protein
MLPCCRPFTARQFLWAQDQFTNVFSVAWAAQNCVLINHRWLEIFLWAVSIGGEKGNILGETHTFLLSS